MKIAVVGAGGVGGYFGARLAKGGEDVRFIARGAQLAAIRERGLHVRSILGDISLAPADAPATNDIVSIGPVEIVLFTVKSFDTERAATSLKPLIGPDTAVISLQNGVDNEEKIAAVIGREHVAGGVAYIFAGIAEPGVIRHTGGPARILFGEMDGARSHRLESFLATCERAGVSAELVGNIHVALWAKYVFICAQAGLTAAARRPIGAIRESGPTWALFRQVLAEAAAVGRAEGVPLPDDLVERHAAGAAGLDPGMYSSLYDDLVAGRRMELDALLGELVRRAARDGVPVPAASTLYAVLLPEATRRTPSGTVIA